MYTRSVKAASPLWKQFPKKMEITMRVVAFEGMSLKLKSLSLFLDIRIKIGLGLPKYFPDCWRGGAKTL